jgi:hypothetical protein
VLDTTSGGTDLRQLLTTLDSAEEAAGWGGPPQLVGVEGRQLGYVELPGHPYDALLGRTVPASWEAIAVIAEGWGAVDETADFVRSTSTERPSRTFGRQRVRAIGVFDRHGGEVSGYRCRGAEFQVMEGPVVGRIADAARRVLGCPTPPPGFPVVEYFAQRWLAAIASSAKRGRHAPKAPGALVDMKIDDELLALDNTEGWELLRHITARGNLESPSVTQADAAWMDAGMFARTVIGELPPLDTLAKQARRRVDAAGRKQIDACLARLGGDRAA